MHNQCSIARKKTQEEASESTGFFSLCRRIQHILNKYSISRCGVIDENMGNGTNQFPVLNDGTATHADVK
jgi:hypothetical protein